MISERTSQIASIYFKGIITVLAIGVSVGIVIEPDQRKYDTWADMQAREHLRSEVQSFCTFLQAMPPEVSQEVSLRLKTGPLVRDLLVQAEPTITPLVVQRLPRGFNVPLMVAARSFGVSTPEEVVKSVIDSTAAFAAEQRWDTPSFPFAKYVGFSPTKGGCAEMAFSATNTPALQSRIGQSIRSTTKEFYVFRLDSTYIEFDFLPSYRIESIGIFNNFFVYRTERKPKEFTNSPLIY